jgi:hypothetical protein
LAQQLLAAGEQVVDIPATLASRVRLLGTGRSEKNDPNDAHSVAIAALRAPALVPVRVEDHATVLRLLARRHSQIAWARNKSVCRLHALVGELTLTEIFGIGDVVAATLIGHTGDVARFATEDKFAAYNGTAPIEWSSGNPKRPTHRLSRRGNRTMNHALHIAAVTQLRHAHSPGRAFFDRKRAEGHTSKSAIRALKRRISNTVYRHLVADARRTTTRR